jgi:hypothetical protein
VDLSNVTITVGLRSPVVFGHRTLIRLPRPTTGSYWDRIGAIHYHLRYHLWARVHGDS